LRKTGQLIKNTGNYLKIDIFIINTIVRGGGILGFNQAW